MQEKLFRKSALDRMASPERLDMLMQVVSFRAWLAPVAALGLIAAAALWAFTGRVPISVAGQGILLHGGRIDTLEAPAEGVVTSLTVNPGDALSRGATIGQIAQGTGGQTTPITSPFDGRVLDTQAQEGSYLQAGASILKSEPAGEPLEALLFVSPADSKRLTPGMTAQLLPSTVRQEEYGYLVGTITSVGLLPMSQAELARALGDAGLIGQMQANPNPVEVRISLKASTSNPSGYEWTSPRGPDGALQGGTFIAGRIILKEIRPIDLMLSRQ